KQYLKAITSASTSRLRRWTRNKLLARVAGVRRKSTRKKNMRFKAVILEGAHVRLEPLANRHRAELCEAISDGELWKLFVTLVPQVGQIDAFYAKAKSDFEAGD